jgi:hypothetical protein
MDAHYIFLESLTIKDKHRTDYFRVEQNKSGYSKEYFYDELLKVHDHYKLKIFEMTARIKSMGGTGRSELINLGIPLATETNFTFAGHLKASDLKKLKANIEEAKTDRKEGTQPEGLQCLEQFTPDKLKAIYSKLIKDKFLKCSETDFLKAFQVGTFDCLPIQWNGSNPELATLILRLTGINPTPSIVNLYFKPKKAYDSHSKRGTPDNHKIKLLIK